MQQLRYAVAVADHGSFRRAAEALLVRQSTLSRCIRQLEHSVRMIVFGRSSGGSRRRRLVARGHEMRRVVIGLRNVHNARSPDDVARSPLGSRIPLVSLIHALAVAEHLNFRHAASALGVSQSSVSTRIKQLEQELGTLLFERRHRGVRLTEAGQHFLEHVATGIEHLDHAVRTAGTIARGEQGRLRVGLYSSIAAGFLAELLGQFRELHPAVDLQITEGRARDTIREVREARLDVAFVVGVPPAGDCHSKPLWTEVLLVALPERHPLAGAESVMWSELASENFLTRSGGAGPQVHDHIVLRLAEHWSQPRIQRFEVERDTLMSMVAQGYGIMLTSEAEAQASFPGVVFRLILDEPEPITFSALWSPHNRSQALLHLLALAQRKSEGKSQGIR